MSTTQPTATTNIEKLSLSLAVRVTGNKNITMSVFTRNTSNSDPVISGKKNMANLGVEWDIIIVGLEHLCSDRNEIVNDRKGRERFSVCACVRDCFVQLQ